MVIRAHLSLRSALDIYERPELLCRQHVSSLVLVCPSTSSAMAYEPSLGFQTINVGSRRSSGLWGPSKLNLWGYHGLVASLIPDEARLTMASRVTVHSRIDCMSAF